MKIPMVVVPVAIIAIATFVAACAGVGQEEAAPGSVSATPNMRDYAVDMPNHVLRFSLPDDVAEQMLIRHVDNRFDPIDKIFQQDGFHVVVHKYLEFYAPVWSGPLGGPSIYGGLRFEFSVVKRDSNYYSGDITSLDGLDRYVRQWIDHRESKKGFQFGRTTIMNKEWIYRWRNTIDGALATGEREPTDVQAFYFPINEYMFLQIYFEITDYEPTKSQRWRRDAEAIRDEIKTTIVLEP
jgi:hypothetical protein